MRDLTRIILVAAVGLFLAQCGKKPPKPQPLPFGTAAHFEPVDLMNEPTNTVYEGWVVTLDSVRPFVYTPHYKSFGRFGWNVPAFSFLDSTGQARSGDFETGQNLFTEDFPGIKLDTIKAVALRMANRDTVKLSFRNRDLARLKALLVTIEPKSETDSASRATPSIPFLFGPTNSAGVFDFVYPVDYKTPDVSAHYFLATPSDTLINLVKDTTVRAKRDEARGIWIGVFDPHSAIRGLPDTGLAILQRPNGWFFETWFQKGSNLVSLGKFDKPDSADLSNRYTATLRRRFDIPGEDFKINNPPIYQAGNPDSTVLKGTLMITLEPNPDPDSAIFPLILFRDTTRSTLTSFIRAVDSVNEQRNFLFDNRARFFPRIKVTAIPK